MTARAFVLSGSIGGLAVLTACSSVEPRRTDPALLLLRMTSAPLFVRNVVIRVGGPGIQDSLVFSIDVANGTAADTLTVPAGSARYISATALDSLGVATHRGDTTLALLPGLNPPLQLALRPLNATVPIIITFGDVVARVQVRPAALILSERFASASLRAVALTALSDTVPWVRFAWRTLNPDVASVDSLSGLVVARRDGQVTIAATVDGVTGYALATVSVSNVLQVASWTPLATGISQDLARVWGLSDSNVYAVGNGGAIIHYNGTNWTAMTSGTAEALRGLWGTSDSEIYAVGTGPTILRFNGTSWAAVASGATQGMRAVWGTSGSNVIVVGDAGTILRFNGSTWSPLASGTTEHLNGVWGTSGSDIFIVGENGTILRSNGTSWSVVPSGTTQHLTHVWGTSASDVYAVGETGTILRFDGTTWNPMTSGTTQHLNGLWGTSSSDIYASGAGGTLLHFNGTSWTSTSSGTTQWIHGLWGTSGLAVHAVGLGPVALQGTR